MCLARLPNVVNVPVAYGDDNSPLGVIDLGTCLQAVNECSPELIAGRSCKDYAVYSVDFTEPDQPLVGHGMLSWVTLQRMALSSSSSSSPVWLAGKVTNNILPLYAAKETLEVHLRLFPLEDKSQEDYLDSIRVYESLAKVLPGDFNHPAWARFIVANPSIMRYDGGSRDVRGGRGGQNQINIKRSYSLQEGNSPDSMNQTHQHSHPHSHPHPPPHPHSNSHSNAQPRRGSINSIPITASPSSPIHPSKRYKSISNDQQQTYYPASSPPPISSSASFGNSLGQRNQGLVRSSSPVNTMDSGNHHHSTTSSNVISTQKGLIRLSSIDLSSSTFHDTSNTKDNSSMTNNTTTRARGRRRKGNDDAPSADTIVQCDNCGTTKTPTWRRVKTTDKKDRNLCNPCGLWYQTKKTMRPESLWHNAPKTSKKRIAANAAANNSSNGNGSGSNSGNSNNNANNNTNSNNNINNLVNNPSGPISRSASSTPIPTAITPANTLITNNTGNALSNHPDSNSANSTPSSTPINIDTNKGGDTIESTGHSPEEPTHSVTPRIPQELPISKSLPLQVPISINHQFIPPKTPKLVNKHVNSDEESDKENMPPPRQEESAETETLPTTTGATSPHHINAADIDSLFETPKKNRIRLDINTGSVTPTSKWIAKLIQPRSDDDEDVFRAFLDSPSKRALGGNVNHSSNSNTDGDTAADQFNSVVSDMTFGGSMENSSIPSEPLMMPSSPPSSFFYLYDENTSQWPTKQWGHDSVTTQVTPSDFNDEDDDAAPSTVKSLQ